MRIKSTLALLNNSFKNNEKWNEIPADKIEAIKYEFFLLLVLTYRNLELMNLKGLQNDILLTLLLKLFYGIITVIIIIIKIIMIITFDSNTNI